MQTLAIVGASLDGLSAARAARAQGFSGRLVIIGDEHHRPYDRPPLSKDFLMGTITAEDLFLETDDDGLNAEWILGGSATGLDTDTRTIRLHDGRTVTADGIVIATGARARQIPALAGLDNVFYLRTMADAQGLTPRLVAGARMIVVGAGFIGAEVASAAASRGMDVTMINNSPVPFTAQLGQDMGSVVANLHEANGVGLICGTAIDAFHSTAGSVTGLRLADGRELAADVAAVGDCAAWFDAAVDKHRRVEHWTGALERAALAVQALLDSDNADGGFPA